MFRAMDMIVLLTAALAAHASALTPISASAPGGKGASVAQRSPGGAVATATITVRIISSSARINAEAPPLPAMTPRTATILAADGSEVAALIYDFE